MPRVGGRRRRGQDADGSDEPSAAEEGDGVGGAALVEVGEPGRVKNARRAASIGEGLATELGLDEQIVVFASAARLSEGRGGWIVPVHGRIYRPARGRAAKAALRLALKTGFGVIPDDLNQSLFDGRCALMLGDNLEHRRVVVALAGSEHVLMPTGADGRFSADVVVQERAARRYARNGALQIDVRLATGDARAISGQVLLVPERGISVISDIDDTVKVTHVSDRRRMMALTFLNPFEAIDGMAARYREWNASGAVFHFLSSSPWTLYEPLAAFLEEAGFPPATLTLKSVGLKDRSIRHFLSKATKTKPPAIDAMLAAFPGRTFVLIGDGVERDAEIYADVALRNPGQVSHIMIREAEGLPRRRARVARALAAPRAAGVDCRTFASTDDLPAKLG